MNNLNQIKIYEFSRGFTVVLSQKHQTYVSGGYGKKIDRENHPVPQEIKDNVFNKCF